MDAANVSFTKFHRPSTIYRFKTYGTRYTRNSKQLLPLDFVNDIHAMLLSEFGIQVDDVG
jgi:hypothetical protein